MRLLVVSLQQRTSDKLPTLTTPLMSLPFAVLLESLLTWQRFYRHSFACCNVYVLAVSCCKHTLSFCLYFLAQYGQPQGRRVG